MAAFFLFSISTRFLFFDHGVLEAESSGGWLAVHTLIPFDTPPHGFSGWPGVGIVTGFKHGFARMGYYLLNLNHEIVGSWIGTGLGVWHGGLAGGLGAIGMVIAAGVGNGSERGIVAMCEWASQLSLAALGARLVSFQAQGVRAEGLDGSNRSWYGAHRRVLGAQQEAEIVLTAAGMELGSSSLIWYIAAPQHGQGQVHLRTGTFYGQGQGSSVLKKH
jgi:hypothetical protein